jgi:PAS domain S-box-containing protein
MPPDSQNPSAEQNNDESVSTINDPAWQEIDRLRAIVHKRTTAYVEQLSRSRNYLERHVGLLLAMLQSIGDGLIVVDQEGNHVLFNEAAASATGMQIAEMDVYKWAASGSVYFPDKVTPVPLEGLPIYKAMQGIPTEDTLFYRTVKKPDGQWFRVNATPIRDEAGNLHGAVAIFHDMSEIIEASERIQDLYNSAPCGYHSMDADDNVVEINDTELTWLGYSRDEIIGKLKFADLVTADFQNIYADCLGRLQECRPVREVAMQLTRKDGSIMPVLWNGTAVTDNSGNFFMTRSVIFDITDRTKLIQQRDNLAAIVTHDLKNHLFGESELLAILLEECAGQLTASQESSMRLLQTNSVKHLQLINSLMEIYRYEIGAETLRFEATDITPYIARCVDELMPTLKAGGLILESSLAKTLLPVSADVKALHHVFNNVIGNAIKYTPSGGCIKVASYNQDNQVIVTIADNGKGIPKNELDTLFQATLPRHESHKPVGSTGLGLYLCRKILESHGATINCTSDIATGTTFIIMLPGKK